ncbi:MAG: SCO family protein [Leucothrix sp.]
MNKIALGAIAALLISILAVVTLFISTSDTEFDQKTQKFSDLGGEFTLSSQAGPVSLSDFKGKVVVMYFGFLSCPEVCPNSMTTIRTALKRLDDDNLKRTQALLVSIDPKRDTLEKLAKYAEYFHPNLAGITGTKANIDAVTKQYGAYYNFTEIESASQDYGVEHSSRYYVIDQQGKLVAAMRHSTTPNELYAQIVEVQEKG